MLKNFFRKQKRKTTIKKEYSDSIIPFVNDIVDILQIERVYVQLVDCLYNTEGQVMAQVNLQEDELPKDAQYCGGYYFDEKNTIILPRKYCMPSDDYSTTTFVDLTTAELLFGLAHELRHVWQHTYHMDKYYQTNAVNFEIVDDKAEIDADAFALSFVFSNKTSFSVDDIPHYHTEICLQATIDNGSRWLRAKELTREYDFGDYTKIEKVKTTANYNVINRDILLMKKMGLI
ncbi:MAG: hypothetical protein K6G88_11755 [Lachnospiraceae bacterium]|nr:hypothetical protein [Lachnospiraceae bacterium]